MNHTVENPSLSVVLPVYNAARFLGEALNSILEQDFRDFECIAIDDGSTDESPSILEDYGRRDVRLRVVHQGNAGLVETLNRGIALSRAPLVARMDADDVCLPGRFNAQMRYFAGRDDLGVLGGQVQLIDEEGGPLRLVDYPADGDELKAFLNKGSPLAHPAVMLRKAAVEKVGLYRQAFAHAEDYDLWLRMHEAGWAIENLKVPLINYRQHSGKISFVRRREQAIGTLAARCAHRARVAGLPDPTADQDRLDETVFERFPAALVVDFQEDLFAVRMGMTPLESEDQLMRALSSFRELPINLQRTRSATRFLLNVAAASWRHRLYSLAVVSGARAVTVSPIGLVSVVAQKLVRSFRGLRSQGTVRSGQKLVSLSDLK